MASSSFHPPSSLSPPSHSHLRPPLPLIFSFPPFAASVLFNSSVSRTTSKLMKHGRLRCTKSEAPATSDPKSGTAVYKPKSYEVLVTNAAESRAFALDDGMTHLEIDFPSKKS